MFYKKKGFPEEGEIVLATVKKILYHSVFVELDEYEHKEGMIHISEVSPGRIRTLSDYVKEGKKIICKVLNVDKSKGNIDLSLRRVSTSAKIAKSNEIKQEQNAEKLLGFVAKGLKMELKDMYSLFGFNIIEEYGSLNIFFNAVVEDKKNIVALKLDKKVEEVLYTNIKDKIKPQEVSVFGNLILKSYSEDGINVIKKILKDIEKKGINVSYNGAPKYRLQIVGKEYKNIEKKLDAAVESAIEKIKSGHGEGEFIKNG